MNANLAILITAYKTDKYIKDCLDSIAAQDYKDFIVYLGIDHCPKTLEKVKQIKHLYPFLRVFYFSSNQGTYITSNTLLYIGEHNYYLRFDSDDVMMPNMLSSMLKEINTKNNYCICRFIETSEDINDILYQGHKYADGIVMFTNKMKEVLGGWKAWRCSADSDLLFRMRVNGLAGKETDLFLFRRRNHSEQLSFRKETRLGNPLRLKLISLMVLESYLHKILYVEPVKNTYKEV